MSTDMQSEIQSLDEDTVPAAGAARERRRRGEISDPQNAAEKIVSAVFADLNTTVIDLTA